MVKNYKHVMTPQEITEAVKEMAQQRYPTYNVNREPKFVMPSLQQELDKIVENDIKINDLEKEGAILDTKILEFMKARKALESAAKTIDRIYPDLIKVADEAGVVIESFKEIPHRITKIIETMDKISVKVKVDETEMTRLFVSSHNFLDQEEKLMEQHIKAIEEKFRECYITLNAIFNRTEGVWIPIKRFTRLFWFLIAFEIMVGFGLALLLI